MNLLKIVIFILIFNLFIIPTRINAQPFLDEKKIAIIIDDLGNSMDGTKEILALPIPITVAVMPFLPSSKSDAEWAHRLGHDVILHLPMEPVKGKKSWLGPGAITTDLSDREIRSRVEAAIKEIPYAIGVNNHMGSKVTADRRVMKIILEVCKQYGLIYIDSKTSSKSVVLQMANDIGVPCIENQLFFDEIYTKQHIIKQTKRLIRKLQYNDEIVAIGHVGPPGEKTAAILKEFIPIIENETNAKFVRISSLIQERELLQ